MEEPRRTGLVPLVVIVAALLLPAIYVVAYFAAGTPASATFGSKTYYVRVYSYEWQEHLFRPAARLESALSLREIDTAHRTN